MKVQPRGSPSSPRCPQQSAPPSLASPHSISSRGGYEEKLQELRPQGCKSHRGCVRRRSERQWLLTLAARYATRRNVRNRVRRCPPDSSIQIESSSPQRESPHLDGPARSS